MSKRRHPKLTKSDARRRRRMRWFLGIFAAMALIVATMRAIMIRMNPSHGPLSPRQAMPESPQR